MKYLLLILTLVVSMPVFAQTSRMATLPPGPPAIRFNLLGLFDFLDGNISLGAELPLNSRFSVTADIGLVSYSAYIRENKGALGYIVKPALRYYTSDNHRGFLEGVLFYKQVGYKLEDWIDKQPVNGAPTFQEFEAFTLLKRVVGANFQAGLQRNISNNKRLKLEGYLGVGVRLKWQRVKDNPDATYRGNGLLSRSNDPNQTYLLPSLPMGMRLVYAIK